LSKIETLTLAKNYIKALTNVICEMRGESAPYEISEKGQTESGSVGDEGVDEDAEFEALMSSSIRPTSALVVRPSETGASRRRRRRQDDEDRVPCISGADEDMSDGENSSDRPPQTPVMVSMARTPEGDSVLVSDGFGGHFLTSDLAPLDAFSTRAASIAAQKAMN